MSSGHGSRPGSSAIELALGAGALAMAVGAFAGHALAPDRVADHYGWVRDRWYQREIGAFNAGLGYGIIAYARGRREEAFLGSWSTAAILMALTRLLAVRSGDRRGVWNLATVAEDAALGIGGLMLLRRDRIAQ
ncbi:MAG: hypothetical protein QOG75_3749 [Mycobacterium sp.]|nr:hypothetical protein [Mycobacterium sp.]